MIHREVVNVDRYIEDKSQTNARWAGVYPSDTVQTSGGRSLIDLIAELCTVINGS